MSLSEEEKATIRQNNGRIVMEALEFLEQPETIGNVVKYVASSHEVDAADVREPVQRTLDKGVLYGFIEKNGSRYGIQRNIQPEELVKTPGRRGSISSYASKTRSKSGASKPKKSMRGRSRTSRSKSKTKSRSRSMSGRSSSRAKGQKTTARKGRGSSRGRK